ncbi:MAG: DUF5717 family protein [Lachnospiraceae bacterium]
MQRRIEELARGQFNYDRPVVELSVEKIELNVPLGQCCTGEFQINSLNRVPIEGQIFSSNGRMECKIARFSGTQVRVKYKFHSEGLEEGNIQKGVFSIICNGGEYSLSFVAYVTRNYQQTSTGLMRHMHDFVRLAQTAPKEAEQFFHSSAFRELLHNEDDRAKLLYREICRDSNGSQAVEEYLCGLKKKKRIAFRVLDSTRNFQDIKEPSQELLQVEKDSWGYLSLSVTADSAGICFSKQLFETEDFVGDVLQIPYVIDPQKLHHGKNFIRITIAGTNQIEQVELLVEQTSRHPQQKKLIWEKQKYQAELTKLYMDYRFQKIVTGEWCQKSNELLDQLFRLTKQDIYRLMKAQAYLLNKQRQEAEWILDAFKREHFKETDTTEWAYYLYLLTLIEREASYVNKLTEEIEVIYQKRGKPEILFWVLLFLREDYFTDHKVRQQALEKHICSGHASPFFYMEAFYLYQEEPNLMKKLGTYEKRILLWGLQRKGLTHAMMERFLKLLSMERSFDEKNYQILCGCYEQYQTEELAEIICRYLTRFSKYGVQYQHWYAMGIEKDFRITNLYESYLLSIDSQRTDPLPKEVQIYFQYNTNTLPVARKAILYVNIIKNRNRQPDVLEHYMQNIEDFALRQMEQHHMDANLALIYDTALEAGMVNPEITKKLSELFYTCQFVCKRPDIRYVIVAQQEWKKVQVVPLVNHIAYVQVYSANYVILLEDIYGNLLTGLEDCELEKLMHPSHYIRKCISWAPEKIPYLLHYFSSSPVEKAMQNDKMDLLMHLIKAKEIREEYRKTLICELVRYCYEAGDFERVAPYLKKENLSLLDGDAHRMAVEILVELHEYEAAYEQIPCGSVDQLQSGRLLSLCSYLIIEHAYEWEKNLLYLSEAAYRAGKYNDVLLNYLVKYYEGPTAKMAALFRTAKNFLVDTAELEERLLVQMLSTAVFVENTDEIYESYCKSGGRSEICAAYVSYYSYCSFVKKMVVSESVFEELLHQYQEHTINQMGELALLQWLSQKQSLSQAEREIVEDLLGQCIQKGLYFRFYKQFPHEIQQEFYLYDKIFIEYRTDPGKEVMLCYQPEYDLQVDFKKERMQEMYEGIYVKSFVLFFGEKIQYYVQEKIDGIWDITGSNVIQNADGYNENDDSRYDLLNGMAVSRALEDSETMLGLMEKYKSREKNVNNQFLIL